MVEERYERRRQRKTWWKQEKKMVQMPNDQVFLIRELARHDVMHRRHARAVTPWLSPIKWRRRVRATSFPSSGLRWISLESYVKLCEPRVVPVSNPCHDARLEFTSVTHAKPMFSSDWGRQFVLFGFTCVHSFLMPCRWDAASVTHCGNTHPAATRLLGIAIFYLPCLSVQ